MPGIKQNGKRTWLSLFALVAVCVLLNYLGARLNGLLGLPFYLDNVGTILSALLGGYIPCVTVGFLSNVFNAFSSPDSIYYSVISVFIATAAALFAVKLRRVRIPYVLLAILTFGFIGGVIGGMLTWLIYGFDFGEGAAADLAAAIDRIFPVGYLTSNLISNFLIDVADKAIVTVASLVIFKLLPEKLDNYLKGQDWFYISVFENSTRKIRKRFSLRVKSTLLFAASTLLIAAAAIGTSVIQYHNSTLAEYSNQAQYAAHIIATHIDTDSIESYLRDGRDAEGYARTEELMQIVSDASPEIAFMYIYRVRPDGTHVIFDLSTEETEADAPGSVIEYDDTISKYLDLFLEGREIPVDVTNDEDGWLLSVYEPIRGASGKVLCYVGVDMSMANLQAEETSFLAKITALFIGFLILIRTYAVWMAERHIIIPVNTIADAANSFTYDTPQAREESMKMIENLNIDTGDEIEYLYDAYKKTTADTVHFIDEVQRKSDQVIRLQNGLVLVLADMVESRDKCTGDHVRKTAAYCEIILRQMQKDGIYADQLSEEFITEVVSSAPLHDVGKIKVSDTILNKPGRLTDEEFKKMQNHTTAGGEIIDKVITTVGEESEYLTEAKNLASFHHEKWNGKGYPTGLQGEEIPLSARVMAVADVFDALVSRRSYKEPFSVDKAMEIIREDAGTHFDPLIVEAFFNAEEEIRRVQKLNMEL
ncbi:MAG: HD domain-containing protein [Ruminococcus sp.]|uniref:HD domain-containing phosphohydrolase n=1 Tax=Ruminococcus sp. TaxID=41978 RepID=UPI0028735BF8|nr:HD domain-containing phosphohydrolase [Ruminococcus sp.]MBQ3285450.1 HD domain-containing protein [Ruminococcus sp.]MBQ3286271.1 HD domain-containing protein [Ruminococcus sp.]